MTMQAVKVIGKTIGVFIGCFIVAVIIVPIICGISGILSAISVAAIPVMLFMLLFSKGRKMLTERIVPIPTWSIPVVLYAITLISSPPVLFALSLILHWHLATTIVLGIVASLVIIISSVLIFYFKDLVFLLFFFLSGSLKKLFDLKKNISFSNSKELYIENQSQNKFIQKNKNINSDTPKYESTAGITTK